MNRFNSRIVTNRGQCPQCPPGVIRALTAGKCSYHYKIYRHTVNKLDVRLAALKRMNENGYGLELIRKKELEKWYADIRMRECLGGGYIHGVGFVSGGAKCWECGDWIIEAFFKHATAHILPKKKGMFPSIATHPLNYMILGGACGCHNKWDSSWDNAVKMQVFPIAKTRYQQFAGAIAPAELERIPIIFR